MTSLKYDIVIYHQNCPDGIGSLWCVNKFNKSNNYKYDIISTPAGKNPIGNFSNKKLLFLDVSPDLDFIKNSFDIVESITVIDHHKTTLNMYSENQIYIDSLNNIKFVLDMKLSGCQLTWDYFYNDEVRPWFIEYIADRDLWTWKLENSKEISSALYYKKLIDCNNLELMNQLLCYTKDDISKLYEIGKIVIDVQNKILQDQAFSSIEGTFDVSGNKYNVIFGTVNKSMRSDFGNLLVSKPLSNNTMPDFCVVWMYDPLSSSWYFSLRGNDNSPDLSVIAKYFGGGGHAKAAGFEYNKNPFGSIFIINTKN